MAIGISEAHIDLAKVVRSFLDGEDAQGAGIAMLDGAEEALPPFWAAMAELGWLGIHVPEAAGGSGYGLPELLVVVEELGHALAPGPFLPTVLVSALVAESGDEPQRTRWLPPLVDGSRCGALGLRGDVASDRAGRLSGEAIVLGGGLAGVLALVAGDDVVVVEASSRWGRRSPGPVDGSDPTLGRRHPSRRREVGLRRAGGQRRAGVGNRADARGRRGGRGARRCVEMATSYAKERQQFGRPIAMFQAVKHHCANMLVDAETATAAVWDAGRASEGNDPEHFRACRRTCARHERYPPSSATPSSTSRSTAGSGLRGNTSATSSCGGPSPSPRWSTPPRHTTTWPGGVCGAWSAILISTCLPRRRPTDRRRDGPPRSSPPSRVATSGPA